MQDTTREKGRPAGLWSRLVRTMLWPLILAEICFALVCLGVGLLVWRDTHRQHQQDELQGLMHTYRLQARLVDQRLAAQQHHVRQLGRATRRLLQSPAPDPVMLTLAAEGRLAMSPGSGLALFGEQGEPLDATWLARAGQLAHLESLMTDLYLNDALIEFLHVSLPQGPVAMVPGREVRASLDELELAHYSFEPMPATAHDPLRWRVFTDGQGAARLAVRLDVRDPSGERVAQVGLALDSAHLARVIQDITGPGGQAWLVDDEGDRLVGMPLAPLPSGAGRRGIEPLGSLEGREMALVWSTLPTTGWRLVSRLPLPEHVSMSRAIGWVGLAWLVGSLSIFAILLMMLRQRMQHWQAEREAPVSRIRALERRVAGFLPRWLSDDAPPNMPTSQAPEASDEPSDRQDPARLDVELDALEATLGRLAVQPRWLALLEGLERPALLTHQGELVTANGAFEHLIGRSRGELQGLGLGDLLLGNGEADESSLVGVRDATGQRRMLRLAWSEDGLGHGLGVLFDETATHQRLQHLTLARERARQDAQLKTRCLSLLRRELDDVLPTLGCWLEGGEGSMDSAALGERLSGLTDLLDCVSDGRDDARRR